MSEMSVSEKGDLTRSNTAWKTRVRDSEPYTEDVTIVCKIWLQI